MIFSARAWWHPQPPPKRYIHSPHPAPGCPPPPLSPSPLPPPPCSPASFTPYFFVQTSSFVDYVKFCGAVEPRTGGRDLDNQRRVLDKAWKVKPKESSTSKVHPLSGRGRAPSGQQHSTRHPLSGRSWEGGDVGGGRGHTQSVRLKQPAPQLYTCRLRVRVTFGCRHCNVSRSVSRLLYGRRGGTAICHTNTRPPRTNASCFDYFCVQSFYLTHVPSCCFAPLSLSLSLAKTTETSARKSANAFSARSESR